MAPSELSKFLRMPIIELRPAYKYFSWRLGFIYLGMLIGNQAFSAHASVKMPVLNEAIKTEATHPCMLNPLRYIKTIYIKSRKYTNRKDVVSDLIGVSGVVTDETSQLPMAAVNIIVKGTTNGTTTDIKGQFNINATEDETLIFSFIGFKTFETRINGRIRIDVVMEPDVPTLQEVVVSTGYWDTDEKLTPGNISKITSKEISKQPVTNVLQALQARVPGMVIEQSTGIPGGGFSVQIRGKNSLAASSSEPLYVVNGVPYSSESLASGFAGIMRNTVNPLNSINPSDIESIEILKDADATAIYGSRGANGVVLIKTKKSTAGKTTIEVSFTSGFSQVGHFMDLLSTPQYLEMKKEALKNGNSWPLDPLYFNQAPDVFLWDTTRYTNWQKKLIGGISKINNARISLSGGSSQTQFLFSGTYNTEGSVFPGSFAYQRCSGLLNINHSSENNKFQFSSSTNYGLDNNDLPKYDLTSQAITLAPTAPELFDENGEINWENNTWENPMAGFLKPTYQIVGDNLNTSSSLRYQIIPGLIVKSNLGYNKRTLEQISTLPFASAAPINRPNFNPTSLFGHSSIKTWIIEPQIEYTFAIKKGTLIAFLGTSFQETKKEGEVSRGTGYTSDAMLKNIKAASKVDISYLDVYQYRYEAIYARLNYNLKDTYVLNLTGRRDGSSRFGPDNRFGIFGAIGASWIFSNERFFKSWPGIISFGKLRASYGTTGSDNIDNYKYLDSYAPTQNSYQGTTGLIPTRLANNDYRWETNRKFEAALELSLLENRISISTSIFQNSSSNQLVGYALSAITGQSSVQRNLPATVRNSGLELTLTTVNINKPLEWTTNFNLTIPRNKLISYPNLEDSPYANSYVIGQPLSVVKGYRYKGVDPLTGQYKFEDLNEDGVLNQYDRQNVGSIRPMFYLGLNNSIIIKRLQIDILIQVVKQTGRSYVSNFSQPGALRFDNNQPRVVMQRWEFPGQVTDYEKFNSSTIDSYNNLTLSNRQITDASFIRLKNTQISYRLQINQSKQLSIKNASLFIQGQNILTLSNYVGLDPESQNSQRLPPLRTFTMGFQIAF